MNALQSALDKLIKLSKVADTAPVIGFVQSLSAGDNGSLRPFPSQVALGLSDEDVESGKSSLNNSSTNLVGLSPLPVPPQDPGNSNSKSNKQRVLKRTRTPLQFPYRLLGVEAFSEDENDSHGADAVLRDLLNEVRVSAHLTV